MKYLKTYRNIFESKQAESLSEVDFIIELKKCKHFKFSDKPILRSIDLHDNYYKVNPNIPYGNYYTHDGRDYRKSAYTNNNHYTLLINHLNGWSEFPKRQVICATYEKYYGDIYRLIPLENVKIGVVPDHDIQDDYDNIFKSKWGFTPYELAYFYEWNKVSCDDWESFLRTLEMRHNQESIVLGNPWKSLGTINKNDKEYKKYNNLFDIDFLEKEFTPENLNFQVINYSDFVKSGVDDFVRRELWIDGEHLLLRKTQVENFMRKYKLD